MAAEVGSSFWGRRHSSYELAYQRSLNIQKAHLLQNSLDSGSDEDPGKVGGLVFEAGAIVADIAGDVEVIAGVGVEVAAETAVEIAPTVVEGYTQVAEHTEGWDGIEEAYPDVATVQIERAIVAGTEAEAGTGTVALAILQGQVDNTVADQQQDTASLNVVSAQSARHYSDLEYVSTASDRSIQESLLTPFLEIFSVSSAVVIGFHS